MVDIKRKKSKVYNTGPSEYREEMDGKEYIIPANGYLEMNRREAVRFVGKYPGYQVHKPLRIEHGEDSVSMFVCNYCGDEFVTEDLLNNHLETHREHSEAGKKEAEEKKVEPVVEKVKAYCCPECDFETTKKVALIGHMRSHKKKEVVNDSKSDIDNN